MELSLMVVFVTDYNKEKAQLYQWFIGGLVSRARIGSTRVASTASGRVERGMGVAVPLLSGRTGSRCSLEKFPLKSWTIDGEDLASVIRGEMLAWTPQNNLRQSFRFVTHNGPVTHPPRDGLATLFGHAGRGPRAESIG
jgi:hypothetical protein